MNKSENEYRIFAREFDEIEKAENLKQTKYQNLEKILINN